MGSFPALTTGNSNARVTISGKEKGHCSVPRSAVCPALASEAGLPVLVVVFVDFAGGKLVLYALPRLEDLRLGELLALTPRDFDFSAPSSR